MYTPTYKVVKSSELYHHGIKGQKWGDRNGPPYPLDYNKHSAKEKRENSKSKIDGKSEGTKINKGLTDEQKRALKIGAAVVGVALVAAGGVYLVKSGKGKELIDRGKNYIDDLYYTTCIDESFDKITIKETIEQAANLVNPDASSFLRESNCGNTVIALEARRRGLDVVAKNNPYGMTFDQIANVFEGVRSDSIIEPNISVSNTDFLSMTTLDDYRKRSKIVEKELKEAIINGFKAEKAMGAVDFPSTYAGHFFYFVKDGSNVKFINPQDTALDFDDYLGTYVYHRNSPAGALHCLRFDDLNFREEGLKEIVTNRVNPNFTQVLDTFKVKGPNFVTKLI